ncbi:UDP-N-acetylglucosamine 1-carboxyvinyltransferase [Tichowtungia aerotolerans]|uniref:UDP-N-acetylglucosamine 1-carboxyvinyltransferase n=1 Tax=Tichowtungia aerotolerans TaxID=2697043 RepID=A0A6P1M8X9_9BACT|nr:UDP-N-acetylglucosamine 1-carboxyvinyltransferase [Tichowtungia aerotolerans]QHI68994.1 UDP-N-acetylglucosamine 1-carboxyvinyltransferase [Tichowtungia aerotolerans]
MAKFIINGGNVIGGKFAPRGNKNAVLPMLAAATLTDQPVELSNVPDIQDVRVMLELLQTLGVSVEKTADGVILCAAGLNTTNLDEELCRRVRASILLAGPLSARHGSATVPAPGGDVIGRRRLDTHFYGLRALGIEITETVPYEFRRKKLEAAGLVLDEASVTATENILMAAVLAEGETTIFNAACEPHVQDLANLLVKMGANISGIGTNLLKIRGKKTLDGATHTVAPDYIETGSFLTAAAVTGGSLEIENPGDSLTLGVLKKGFEKLGTHWVVSDGVLTMKNETGRTTLPDLGNFTPKIEDGIWPAFPSDLMSVMIVLATQTQGQMLFFEKLFESRMYFVDNLMAMGANIIQCDPHRVVVSGASKLSGARLSSPDIRAGMAMLIAACCAEGHSEIDNAHVIDRGYESIDERLRALGADIVREA